MTKVTPSQTVSANSREDDSTPDITNPSRKKFICSAKVTDKDWRGSTRRFLLHWENQVRLYESQLDDKVDRFSQKVKRFLLGRAVHPLKELCQVKIKADLKAAMSGRELTYDSYFKLLLAATSRYDAHQHIKKMKSDMYEVLDQKENLRYESTSQVLTSETKKVTLATMDDFNICAVKLDGEKDHLYKFNSIIKSCSLSNPILKDDEVKSLHTNVATMSANDSSNDHTQLHTNDATPSANDQTQLLKSKLKPFSTQKDPLSQDDPNHNGEITSEVPAVTTMEVSEDGEITSTVSTVIVIAESEDGEITPESKYLSGKK